MSPFWTGIVAVFGAGVAVIGFFGEAFLGSLNDKLDARTLDIAKWVGLAIFVAALASAFR